jgi:hypothetical protein
MRKFIDRKRRKRVVKNPLPGSRNLGTCFQLLPGHSDFFFRAINISTIEFPPDWSVDNLDDFDMTSICTRGKIWRYIQEERYGYI